MDAEKVDGIESSAACRLERGSSDSDFRVSISEERGDVRPYLACSGQLEHYLQDIKNNPASASPLRKAMSKLNVPCTDGLTRRLNETVLPSDSLKSAGKHLPFIDVSEPNEPSWLNFAAFGVIIIPTVDLYLRRLKALAALPINDDITKDLIEGIYIQLYSRLKTESEDKVDMIV